MIGIFKHTIFRAICAVIAMAAMSSCASISVHKVVITKKNAPTEPPKEIFILPFSDTDTNFRVGRVDRDLHDFKADLRANMTSELLERIPTYVAPARIVSTKTAIPHGRYWLLTGRFLRVNQGSRLLRSTVGFGAGGTKLETEVIAYDLSCSKPREFMRFETTGGSNISQGICGIVTLPFTGPMALTSLFHVLDGTRSGVTFDTRRTAREITASLSAYLRENNMETNAEPLSPKPLGELQVNMPHFHPKKTIPASTQEGRRILPEN